MCLRASVLVLLLVPFSAAAQTQALPAAQLTKIKAATVYLKVTSGNLSATGSGFVVHATSDYGLIVTNQHVISPPTDAVGAGRPPFPFPPVPRGGFRAPASPPVNIEVVFHSGDKQAEWTAKAELLLHNKNNDLAVLRVKATQPIPQPLDLDGPDKVPETTPVYVCGFPFGEMLSVGDKNPEISIGLASVSSIRTDEKGEVASIQLNGALNPGNSGGPVLTPDGKLVGVAVKTVRAAGIGMAIPPRMVQGILGVYELTSSAHWPAANQSPGTWLIKSQLGDAMCQIRKLTCWVAPVGDGLRPSNVNALKGVREFPIPFQSVPTPLIEVNLPKELTPPVWYQLSWQDATGKITTFPVKKVDKSATLNPAVALDANAHGDGQLKGPDGAELPPLATTLGPTPPNQLEIDDVSNRARQLRGQTITADFLTVGVNPNGYGDGPALECRNARGIQPQGIDCTIDAALAKQLMPLATRGTTAVRAKGKMMAARTTAWEQFVIDEVSLLGLGHKPVVTYRRGEVDTAAPGATAPQAPNSGTTNRSKVLAKPRDAESKSQEKQYLGQLANGGYLNRTCQFMFILTTVKPAVPSKSFGASIPDRLMVQDLSEQPIESLELYATPEFAERIRKALQADGRERLPAQITFTVNKYDARKRVSVADVKELSFFDAELNQRGWTATSTPSNTSGSETQLKLPGGPNPSPMGPSYPGIGAPGSAPPPMAPEQPAATPNSPVFVHDAVITPRAVVPATAVPTPAAPAPIDAALPPPAAADGGGNTTLYVVVGVVVLLAAALSLGLAVYMVTSPKKSRDTKKRRRRDLDDDDDDEPSQKSTKRVRDDDDDEPPRRTRRK